MWKLFDSIFSKPHASIRVERECRDVPSLHIAFLKSLPAGARGALLTSENPEVLLEQLRAVRSSMQNLDVIIHGADRAPISARALGAWLHTMAAFDGVREVVIIQVASAELREALETARRRGCAIDGL